MAEILDNLMEAVGRTPVLRLSSLSHAHGCRTPILAKLECLNPGGSVKDRPALEILRQALDRGALQPGGAVLVSSAGNSAISFAMVCAALSLRCVAVLPENVPPARVKHLEAYGAKIVTVRGEDPAEACRQAIASLQQTLPDAFVPDLFTGEDNTDSHRKTGQEILEQVGNVDYFVAGVGSGGTITGCGETIRRQCPECRVIAAEPYASPILSGGFPGGHPLTGIGLNFIPDILNQYILNEIIRVKTPDSLALMRDLARLEGLLCGPSSGAALAAAVNVAQRPEAEGKTVVTVLPDGGERYLHEES